MYIYGCSKVWYDSDHSAIEIKEHIKYWADKYFSDEPCTVEVTPWCKTNDGVQMYYIRVELERYRSGWTDALKCMIGGAADEWGDAADHLYHLNYSSGFSYYEGEAEEL